MHTELSVKEQMLNSQDSLVVCQDCPMGLKRYLTTKHLHRQRHIITVVVIKQGGLGISWQIHLSLKQDPSMKWRLYQSTRLFLGIIFRSHLLRSLRMSQCLGAMVVTPHLSRGGGFIQKNWLKRWDSMMTHTVSLGN